MQQMFVGLNGVFNNAFGLVKLPDSEENSEFVLILPNFSLKN